jgi:hypothetical protein
LDTGLCVDPKRRCAAHSISLAGASAWPQNADVEAQHLMAFEAALAELSGLYVVAKDFRPLRTRAESELLPATAELGARLRRLVRQGSTDATAVDTAARETAGLLQEWRGTLDGLRGGELYQSCIDAYSARDQPRLIALIPQLFAECDHIATPPMLYYPVSPSSGRRRPGNSPFLTPDACAARIAALRDEGIAAEGSGTEWWERELVPLTLVVDPEALDTPLALRFDPSRLIDAVFRLDDGDVFRIYAARLRAPFDVVLQEEVDDEWWQAFSGSYASWRTALAEEIRACGMSVRLVGSDSDHP